MKGIVVAVSYGTAHRFSKLNRLSVRLIAGHGIEGDAHAGRFIKHRYQARQTPAIPNNRQIHLIQSELFEQLEMDGFQIKPGELGENITTKGINLLKPPLGSLLRRA